MTNLFQYWDSPPPPADVAAWMAGYRARNPDLAYRAFDRESAASFISRRFGARHARAFADCAVPAMQADYFRYCAVLADGGFYADADSACGAPVSGLLEPGERGVLFRRDNDNVVNGMFGFAAPGAPLLSAALEIATRGIEGRLFRSVWVATGPGIFTYLDLLRRLSPEERATLDFDHIDPEATAGIRLCDAVARALPGDVQGLFDGVAIRSYEQVLAHFPEMAASYKAGARHWLGWSGSIYS